MPPRAIGPLANREILSHFEVAARKAELAEGLLERGGDQMSLRGKERDIAGIVRQRDAAAVDIIVPLHRIKLRHTLYPQAEDIDVFQPQGSGQRKVGGQAASERQPPAGPSFRPVEINAVVVVTADVEAVLRIE